MRTSKAASLTEPLSSVTSNVWGEVPDRQLLHRWVQNRDELAFELILRRHGSLVWGACRRILPCTGNAEDAFQATFLMLVRRAEAIRNPEALGGWLYRTATRISLKLREKSKAQENAPMQEPASPAGEVAEEAHWREIQGVLDEEINQLPEKFRLPFVLCYLEGRTNQQAADVMGCPIGTILSRLHTARQKLQGRLQRRGITLSVAALGALFQTQESLGSMKALEGWLGGESVTPRLPANVLQNTLQASLSFASGQMSDAISTTANALVHETVSQGVVMKLKHFVIVLFAVALIGVSGSEKLPATEASPSPDSRGRKKQERNKGRRQEKPQPVNPIDDQREKPKDALDVPSRRSGVIQFVGTEVKPGEKIPDKRRFKEKVNGKVLTLRKLKAGDRVKKGQLLARVDDLLIQTELEIARQQIVTAENNRLVADKTMREAYRTYQATVTAPPGTFGMEEIERSKLVYERSGFELKSKESELAIAKARLLQTEITLKLHEIRAPADGVITEIYKRIGEAVHEHETVIRLKVPRD